MKCPTPTVAVADVTASSWAVGELGRNVLGHKYSHSTCTKDVGTAIRHSQGYMISILQGPGMGWRGLHKVHVYRIKEN